MDKQGNDKKIGQQLKFHKNHFLAEMFKIEIFVDEEIDGIQKHQESGNNIGAIITQVGLEYEASYLLDLRLSYVIDLSPVPDETANYLVPANDRHFFSVGCGFHWDLWRLDLSYGYLHVKERAVIGRPADGVLDSKFEGGHAHLVGVSLGYEF